MIDFCKLHMQIECWNAIFALVILPKIVVRFSMDSSKHVRLILEIFKTSLGLGYLQLYK